MSETVVTQRMQYWRMALVALGIIGLGIGVVVLLNDIPPARYGGIALWLAGAIIIHDGIAAMAVFGVAVLLRRGRRIPFGVVAVIEAALVVGAITFALVLPAAIKKGIGTANPSILPLDYAQNLAIFSVVLVVVTALVAGIVAWRSKKEPV